MEIIGDVSKARFIAAFFDNLIAIGLSFVAAAMVPETLPIVKGIALVGAYIGYFIIFEGFWSRTIGKYFQGLIVRKLDGKHAGFKEAFFRSLLRVVEVNPVFFGAIPAGIVILSSERKQRLGDMAANTVVVSDKLQWKEKESSKSDSRWIRGQNVHGVEVDRQTRCAHYHSPLDVVAIKFRCCGEWFSCYECHEVIADHEPQSWPAAEFGGKAVLCGACGHQLSITEYFDRDSTCPSCEAGFNPGCANHYALYFEIIQ